MQVQGSGQEVSWEKWVRQWGGGPGSRKTPTTQAVWEEVPTSTQVHDASRSVDCNLEQGQPKVKGLAVVHHQHVPGCDRTPGTRPWAVWLLYPEAGPGRETALP